jgi:type IV pilus assembly protein PilB
MRKKLGEMLIEAGVLTESALRAALQEQKRWGGSLGRTLVEMRQIGEDQLVAVLSRQLGLDSVDLDQLPTIPQAVLAYVPGEMAQNYSIIPFAQPMKFLDLAMADPTNQGIIDELRIRTQLNIREFLAGPKMIERAIAKYYNRGFSAMHSRADVKVPEDLLHGALDLAPVAAPAHEELTFRDPPPASPRPSPRQTYSPVATTPRGPEIDALQDRISRLEALVERDEAVLRTLLGLLIDKGIATREEILARLG